MPRRKNSPDRPARGIAAPAVPVVGGNRPTGPRPARRWPAAIAGLKVSPIELRLLRTVGEAAVLEFTFTADLRASRICGVVAIGRDVAARRQAAHANAALELQLRRAQKMEALGRLAGSIAHDFNNFLTVILTNCQLARMDLVHGHPAIQSVDQIHEASQRAARMVKQILAFSRQQDEERTALKLQPVVGDA